MAATLDKQLNESVGIPDAEPVFSPRETNHTLNEAWNDFDDGMDEKPDSNVIPNGWKDPDDDDDDEEILIDTSSHASPDHHSTLPLSTDEPPPLVQELMTEARPDSFQEILEEPPLSPTRPPLTQELLAPVQEPTSTDPTTTMPTESLEEPEPTNESELNAEGWEEDLYDDEEKEENGEQEPPSKVEPNEKEPPKEEEPALLISEPNVAAAPVQLVEEHFKTVDPDPVVTPPEAAPAKKEEESHDEPQSVAASPAPNAASKDDSTEQQQQQQQPQTKEHDMAMAAMQSKLEQVQIQLQQREDQLESKMEQFVTMQTMMEAEKQDLLQMVQQTKEEAKRRIQKARDRVEAVEEQLKAASTANMQDAGNQEEIIAALREEGAKLAKKQSEMTKSVRAAKLETRELSQQLAEERQQNKVALERIASLEADLKQTKEDLAAARQGESQAGQLEADLAASREECARKADANLSLDQQVKELRQKMKELKEEVEEAKRGAALESEMESKKIKKEHGNLLSDLETKLRTSEREAGLREDALRHEVTELRKRWQDAVRRADALSMDVQQSTAPLLRQLESMQRQNRAKATAWAELETKLRSDLEDHIIEHEKLSKERNEFKSTSNRLQRMMKDRDEELASCKAKIEEKTDKLHQLESKLSDMEADRQKLKEDYAQIEKLANEGVSKVRSDMMQTVVESEERYRSQLETLEKELRQEREMRSQLEGQVEQLLDNSGMIPLPNPEPLLASEAKEKKLRSKTGQAEILASTLVGMDSDDELSANGDEEVEIEPPSPGGGFAAMEQLNQRLKGAVVELEALRKQLVESEKIRDSLVEELSETRQAKEKLPLYEAKVQELAQDNREKELEIMGLRDDIAEVGMLYRAQMNSLIEEKVATPLNNGHGSNKSFFGESNGETTASEKERDPATAEEDRKLD